MMTWIDSGKKQWNLLKSESGKEQQSHLKNRKKLAESKDEGSSSSWVTNKGGLGREGKVGQGFHPSLSRDATFREKMNYLSILNLNKED